MFDTEVLVAGAGPTGLTLALDLAQRGIKAILVERHDKPLYLPKMERTNPRSMEIYRRLGLADRIRAAAYPADVAMDIFIVTSLAEPPLLQLKYPSVNEAKAAIADCKDGSLPREPYQLVSQYTLEPLLLEEAKRRPNITIRQSTELLSFTQDESGVTAIVRNSRGEEESIRAQYLAACDGGSSVARKQLGINLEGTGVISSAKQVFFACDDFYDKCVVGPGRHYFFAHKDAAKAGVAGVIIVQDDRKHFTLQSTAPDDTDWVAEIREVTGLDIHPEIIYVGEWRQSMMVADRYAGGRVYLAGDAAHLFIPAGGLGMNTGVGDAYDLSWKLAGTLQGWGGPNLLASYELERRPVGLRNTAAAMYAVQGVIEWRAAYTNDVHESAAARAAFAEKAAPLHRRVYDMMGTERGYRYESPIVSRESGTPPVDDSFVYRPSTWPGMRLPHVWLSNGEALHDRIGHGYTLLKLGTGDTDTSALEQALRSTGAALDVMRIDDAQIRKVFERDLILVRPDLHVCWRGDTAPENPGQIAAMVVGRSG